MKTDVLSGRQVLKNQNELLYIEFDATLYKKEIF